MLEEIDEDVYRFKVRKLRRKITIWVWSIFAVLLVGLLVLSYQPIQEQIFPFWFIKRWKLLSGFAVMVIFLIAAFLPVILEANFYPRVLVPPVRDRSSRFGRGGGGSDSEPAPKE